MQCPECGGEHIRKNGHRQHKQNYICVSCRRQFLTQYEPRGYSEDVKRLCLKMYVNGMGVRAISRVTDIAHPTILNWIEQSGELLPDSYDPKHIPQVGNSMSLRPSSARSKISCGFGRWWITSRLGFSVGWSAIIAPRPFESYGIPSPFGNVTSG